MAPKSPHQQKREASLISAISDRWEQAPGQTERMIVGRSLGLDDGDVPEFATIYELQVWAFSMHSLQGSESHFKELGDRMAPKPGRSNSKDAPRGPTAGAMTSNGAATTAEADAWFSNLGAAAQPLAAVEDGEELM